MNSFHDSFKERERERERYVAVGVVFFLPESSELPEGQLVPF